MVMGTATEDEQVHQAICTSPQRSGRRCLLFQLLWHGGCPDVQWRGCLNNHFFQRVNLRFPTMSLSQFIEMRFPLISQKLALTYLHTLRLYGLSLKTGIFNCMSTGLWSEVAIFARVSVVAGVSDRTRSRILSPLVGSLTCRDQVVISTPVWPNYAMQQHLCRYMWTPTQLC